MGVNGKDDTAVIKQLRLENGKLKAQLEESYKHAIKMADTIQMVHLVRIREAAKEMQPKITPASGVEDFQRDLDATSTSLESQQQGILKSKQTFADQAEQLRGLEDRARKWAKKYLHKIKAAAAKAEGEAGIPSPAPTQAASATPTRHDGKSGIGASPVVSVDPPQRSDPGESKALQRNGTDHSVRPQRPRQAASMGPIRRSVSRPAESDRRSRLMEPIGRLSTRTTGQSTPPTRRSASRPAETTTRSSTRITESARRSISRPAESTARSVSGVSLSAQRSVSRRTESSVRNDRRTTTETTPGRRSTSRPAENTIRLLNRPTESARARARSVSRPGTSSFNQAVSRPADSSFKSGGSIRAVRSPALSSTATSRRVSDSARTPVHETSARGDRGRQVPVKNAALQHLQHIPGTVKATVSIDPQPCQPERQPDEPVTAVTSVASAPAQTQVPSEPSSAPSQKAKRAVSPRPEQLVSPQTPGQQGRHAQPIHSPEMPQSGQSPTESQNSSVANSVTPVSTRQRRTRSPHDVLAHETPIRLSSSLSGQQPGPISPLPVVSPPPPEPHSDKGIHRPSSVKDKEYVKEVKEPFPGTRRISDHVLPADGVAEALQGSQTEGSEVMDSLNALKGSSVVDVKEAMDSTQTVQSIANIRTNEVFQVLEGQEAESELLQNYASEMSASFMSSRHGAESDKTWGGSSRKSSRKSRTFLNRLFSHRKSTE